jgi:photosystem II stability/assembly factor-like uncharacterized protein
MMLVSQNPGRRLHPMTRKMSIAAFLVLIIVASVLHFRRDEKEPNHISGAFEALNYWNEQRAYPNDVIPDISHYAAFESAKSKLGAGAEQLMNVDPWETMGPTNIGGRALAIAFNPQNPNTIWVGTASGGLWVSRTGGVGYVAWEHVPTGYPVLGVSTIAVAPDDSNTIYIGTGEVYNYQETGYGYTYRPTRGSYGIGILKTTDGGTTWEKSLDWSYNQSRGVQAVKINPLNPNTVWAGTTHGTFKSTDAGETWAQVDTTIMVWDLAIDPVDTSIVFIGCGNLYSPGYGVYRTIDDGVSWEKLDSGIPATFGGKVHLHISEASPNIVYASVGNGTESYNGATWLCRSTDSGDTWTVQSTEDYSRWQGWFSHDVAASPVDPDYVIAIGIDTWRSTTGGTNLEQVSFGGMMYGRPPQGGPEGGPTYVHSDKHDIVFHPTDPDIFYMATDGGVFRSTDGGDTYEGLNGGLQTVQFYQGFSTSQLDIFHSIGGLQDNGTIRYDGELQWIRVLGGDGAFTAISSQDDNIMYASSQYLNIAKSTDHGEYFNYINDPPNIGDTPFIAPYILGIDDPDVIYAGRSYVFKSTNGGISWTTTNNNQELDGNVLLAFAVSHLTSEMVYATTAPTSTRAGIFRSFDGGDSWDNITGTLPDRYMVDVAVDPNNDANVYVALSGFGTSHLFMSNDFGSSWQDIGDGLPDVPTSAVLIDPLYPEHIYVGNDLGVWVSIDNGDSWSSFSEGLPDAVLVLDLVTSPTDRRIRVATHGNGAYIRDLVSETTGLEPEGTRIPRAYHLGQNYPNPFNPATMISYELPTESTVDLSIYNMSGQKVRALVSGRKAGGTHQVQWDGRDERGIPVASGVYLYRLDAGTFSETRKMVLAK